MLYIYSLQHFYSYTHFTDKKAEALYRGYVLGPRFCSQEVVEPGFGLISEIANLNMD